MPVSNEIRNLLVNLGQPTETEHLIKTPERVEKFWLEFLGHSDKELSELTSFTATQDTTVFINDLNVNSMCAHHLLPFWGRAWIGYTPGERMAGLSKFQRVLNKFSYNLTCQEEITRKTADFIQEQLSPKGVIVVLQCVHSCMVLRGVKSATSSTTTICTTGSFADNEILKANFLASINFLKP